MFNSYIILDIVKLLLDKKCDINAQSQVQFNTALSFACQFGKHEVVSLLLNTQVCDVEQQSKVIIYNIFIFISIILLNTIYFLHRMD